MTVLSFFHLNVFYFLKLKYSWCKMLCNFCSTAKWPICLFLYYLPSCSIPRDWIQFPALYSKASLHILSKHNSLHLPNPNSPSIPLLPPSSLAPTSLFSLSVSLFLFCREVHLYHILILFIYLFIYCLFLSSRAAPAAYGGSQARGLIGAVATGLRHGQSSVGSEPCLQPWPQLMAGLNP